MGNPFKPNLNQLFESFNDANFSAEFMFHLADAEYRVKQGLNKDQTVNIKSFDEIDSGYFKWREMEFNTLMNTDLPAKQLNSNEQAFAI